MSLLMITAVAARADTRNDLGEARDRLRSIEGQIAQEQAELSRLQGELNELAQRIERAASAAERTRQLILATRMEIARAERELVDLQEQLDERAVQAFVEGPLGAMEVLLGATSLDDLTDRMAFLGALGEQNVDLATDVQNRVNGLEARRVNLADLEARQRDALAQLREQRADLERRFAEQQAAYDRVADLRAEATALIRDLEARLKREVALALSVSQGGSGDGVPGPLYACPVRGPHAYADTFGDVHVHPGWTHIHQGNDVIAPYGTPIVAPFDGVATSSTDANAGIYVTVSGAGGSAIMMHMSGTASLGSVRTGDVVGYVGQTGNASGPHTHFEWHPGGGAAADPYPQLNEVC